MWTPHAAVVHAPAAAGRARGQWYYFFARNRAWLAARNLPWRYVITTALSWWGWTPATGIARNEGRVAARGVRDSIRGFPAAIRSRRVIGHAALRRVRALSGRLRY